MRPLPSGGRTAASWLITLLIAGFPTFADAQDQKPGNGQERKPLKQVVHLVEAEPGNEAWAATVEAGAAARVQLRVLDAINGATEGELTVTAFNASQTSVPSVSAKLRLPGASEWEAHLHLAVDGMRAFDVELLLDKPRVGTTYKGRLAFSAAGQMHSWEAVITTPPSAQAKFTANPIPPLKIVRFSPCPWLFGLISCDQPEYVMPFTLVNQSDVRLTHIRVRFEPVGGEANTSTRSNFSIDSFAFREQAPAAEAGPGAGKGGGPAPIKPQQSALQKSAERALDLENRSTTTDVQLPVREQRTLTAVVKPLAAGAYSGTLRFGAAEVEESQEPRLPVVVQVRHHWMLPALVILLGSAVGWFGSNYVAGARKTRALKRRLLEMRSRADDFARTDTLGRTWHCPSEAGSYGLARVHLILSQLGDLARRSVFPMLLQEEEIKLRCEDAERRLAALESVRKARQDVEQRAFRRPAVQMKLHQLLDSLHETLEDPAFGKGQQDAFAKRLEELNSWASAPNFLESYRKAILERLAGADIPHSLDQINAFSPISPVTAQAPAVSGMAIAQPQVAVSGALQYVGVPIEPPANTSRDDAASLRHLGEQLRDWWGKLPTQDQVKAAADIDTLEQYDVIVATLNLLWRERRKPWAGMLAETAAQRDLSLDALFEAVDDEAWKYLEANKDKIVFKAREGKENPPAYEPVLLALSSAAPDVDDSRIQFHPLHVAWHVSVERKRWRDHLAGWLGRSPRPDVRTVSTPGLRMTRYFPAPGSVKVTASLVWARKADPIAIPGELQFRVVGDRRYQWSSTLTDWSEWLVIFVGVVFAAATGVGTIYDATFGSFAQYLTLLTWAAGASTGANLFKQVGTDRTFGGRADATLPTR